MTTDRPVNPSPAPPTAGTILAIPKSIWVLGLVSLCMDMSSELIHSLLPVFLVTVLGASAVTVGVIEGIAEATAAITKVFSGALSDHLGRRKLLTAVGYGLAALSKPLFPLAGSVTWVFVARFADRIGKGIRGAPRDALIGDLAPEEVRGASYGLRQTLDTVGAVAGPLLAIVLMVVFAGDMRAVFWVAVLPAMGAVALLIWGVQEPRRPTRSSDAPRQAWPFGRKELRSLGAPFWWLVAIGAVLTLARFSEAFLVLRAESGGLALALVPVVMVVMNVVYALSAYPAGALSDRMDRRSILIIGTLLLLVADVVLAAAPGSLTVLAGVALWGLHMGLSQGLLAAMVADRVNPERRGTAFGLFNMVSGLTLLAASVNAGWLWEIYGPPATFVAGAIFAGAAVVGLLIDKGRHASQLAAGARSEGAATPSGRPGSR